MQARSAVGAGRLNPALSSLVHTARMACAVDPARALRFLADGRQLGRWALGSMNTVRVGVGLYRGISLFDGTATLIRPVLDRQAGRVDYWVGPDAQHLQPRIQARVVASQSGCVISLRARRGKDMSDHRWGRLIACHEAEVYLIQSLLEQVNRSARRRPHETSRA